MNKAILSFSITAFEDDIDTAEIKALLSKIGTVDVFYEANCEVINCNDDESRSAFDLENAITVRIPSCKTKSIMMADQGSHDGAVLPEWAVDMLHKGVCTEVYAEYLSNELMSTPLYAYEIEGAYALIGKLGFAALADDLNWSSDDRGDDGCECYWLTIALPAEEHVIYSPNEAALDDDGGFWVDNVDGFTGWGSFDTATRYSLAEFVRNNYFMPLSTGSDAKLCAASDFTSLSSFSS